MPHFCCPRAERFRQGTAPRYAGSETRVRRGRGEEPFVPDNRSFLDIVTGVRAPLQSVAAAPTGDNWPITASLRAVAVSPPTAVTVCTGVAILGLCAAIYGTSGSFYDNRIAGISILGAVSTPLPPQATATGTSPSSTRGSKQPIAPEAAKTQVISDASLVARGHAAEAPQRLDIQTLKPGEYALTPEGSNQVFCFAVF